MTDNAPQVSPVSRRMLRALADVQPGTGQILSLYLDLDPSTFGTIPARESAITSLRDSAVAMIERLEHENGVKASLQSDLERAETALRGIDADGAGALAIFACAQVDLFEVLRLPRPIPSEAVIAPRAHLGPLARYAAVEDWCVALINRRTGRLLRGTEHALTEIWSLEDPVHRQHMKGGWSQSGNQRSVEEDVRNHLQHVAVRLQTMLEQAPFDHLLIGATAEMWPQIEDALHDYVRQRIRGRIDVDVEHSGPQEILAVAREAIEAEQRRQEQVLLDRLQEELGRGERAAATPPEVRRALDAMKVDTLILDDRSGDVDDLVDLALRQDSEIRVLHDADPLDRYDHVAALLRY